MSGCGRAGFSGSGDVRLGGMAQGVGGMRLQGVGIASCRHMQRHGVRHRANWVCDAVSKATVQKGGTVQSHGLPSRDRVGEFYFDCQGAVITGDVQKVVEANGSAGCVIRVMQGKASGRTLRLAE